jgi:anti-anti-sigma factor
VISTRVRSTASGTVLFVHGEIDLDSGPLLESAVANRLGTGPVLTLDLGGVTFIDCAGLGALFRTDIRARYGPTTVLLGTVSAPVARLLALTGVALFGRGTTGETAP